MIITDIKKQVKDTERYSIYIDNKFVFGLSGVDVLYYRLKIGNEIPQEKYDEILGMIVSMTVNSNKWTFSEKNLNPANPSTK